MDDLRIGSWPVVSLDLETGGLIPGRHTPLSIGAVWLTSNHEEVNHKNSFYAQLEWDWMVVTSKALQINKLDIANPPGPNGDFSNKSYPAADGIRMFQDWLIKHSTDKIYALGMNVGSFDLAMLRSIWQGHWPFHYKSIDLNTLLYLISQIQNRPFDVVKSEITDFAWESCPFSREVEHNALADAWFNVHMWKRCFNLLANGMETLC